MPRALLSLSEALRIFRRARHVKREGFRNYPGTQEAICRAIIADAYDQERGYFRVSSGHFCEFYVRDFALCCEALADLGYGEEVSSTLRYALRSFEREGRTATMITPEGKAHDFPSYGPDTLALLLYALSRTGNQRLARSHQKLLQREATRFARLVIDEKTGLPRRDARFTSMRDHAQREASCYDMAMIALAAKECEALGLRFPLSARDAALTLAGEYWNAKGGFFWSDLQRQDIVVGDANVMPFWTGACEDKAMRRNACAAIARAGLDDPFPLRYVSTRDASEEKVRWHAASLLAPGYETDSIWAHLGLAYVRVLAGVDRQKAQAHLRSYGMRIARYRTFLEVYGAGGEPYETPFYIADEAMLWCAPWLSLSRRLKVRL